MSHDYFLCHVKDGIPEYRYNVLDSSHNHAMYGTDGRAQLCSSRRIVLPPY